MPWSAASPDGTASVSTNRTQMNANNVYIQTNLGNVAIGTNLDTTKDHFWNTGDEFAGRHRFLQSVGFTSGGSEADPAIGVAMECVAYPKRKIAQESTAAQNIEYFLRNTSGIMQFLNIRAMGVFSQTGTASPTQSQVVYSHNLGVQPGGIVRDSLGQYTITFASALPTANYLVYVGGIRNETNAFEALYGQVKAATTLSTVKSTSMVKINFRLLSAQTGVDPLQGWFVCFGG